MKKIKILYWVFTGLFAAAMTFSAIPDALNTPEAINIVHTQLGYPLYFIPFIGVVKLLGVLAILIPINATVEEWAYAGLVFDLIGASYSSFAMGVTFVQWLPMLIFFVLAAASYYYYHKKRKAGHSLPAEKNVFTGRTLLA